MEGGSEGRREGGRERETQWIEREPRMYTSYKKQKKKGFMTRCIECLVYIMGTQTEQGLLSNQIIIRKPKGAHRKGIVNTNHF